MDVKIYHNPRCSKSRQTLDLLLGKGIRPVVVKYLETPMEKSTLVELLDMLSLEPRDLMRKKEKLYRELGLDDPSLSGDQLTEAMLAHPQLMERPIVVAGARAALGRPPEAVLEILTDGG